MNLGDIQGTVVQAGLPHKIAPRETDENGYWIKAVDARSGLGIRRGAKSCRSQRKDEVARHLQCSRDVPLCGSECHHFQPRMNGR